MKVMMTILAVLILSACSAEQRAAIEYANQQIQGFNDQEARVLMAAPCAMRLGAFSRLNEAQQKAVMQMIHLSPCGQP